MLRNGNSMIIDANMNRFYEMAINKFKEFDARLFFIKLECSEEVILDRIEKRLISHDLNNYSKADKETYFINKERFKLKTFPEEYVFATINTDDDIDRQVNMIINKISEIIK